MKTQSQVKEVPVIEPIDPVQKGDTQMKIKSLT